MLGVDKIYLISHNLILKITQVISHSWVLCLPVLILNYFSLMKHNFLLVRQIKYATEVSVSVVPPFHYVVKILKVNPKA